MFGIKEDPKTVAEKFAGQDELPNLETKKASDRNCEFWLEFENKARLHIAMLDPVAAEKDLIPPQTNPIDASSRRHPDLGSVESIEQIKPDTGEGASPSRKADSQLGDPNAAAVDGGNMGTIDSTIRESKDRTITDNQPGDPTKTVTIDASEPTLIDRQASSTKDPMAVSKSQLMYDPNYESDKGASMTFTYKEGLVVQILPNGNVQQNLVRNSVLAKKNSVLSNDM